jgi:hypothetical protein
LPFYFVLISRLSGEVLGFSICSAQHSCNMSRPKSPIESIKCRNLNGISTIAIPALAQRPSSRAVANRKWLIHDAYWSLRWRGAGDGYAIKQACRQSGKSVSYVRKALKELAEIREI